MPSLIKTTREQVLAILKTARDLGLIPDLTGRDMSFVDLEEVDFDRASLVGASLVGASLDRASLDGASLVGASLVGASLVGASLDGASLDRASLDGASLVGASLDGASLVGASLVGASLDGASLVGASLVGASLEKAFVLGLPSMPWTASISPTTMKLGCQIHPHSAWEAFTDERIHGMASGALEFWKTWKPILMPLCKAAAQWLAEVKPVAQEGAETVRMPLDTWYGGYGGQHAIRWTASSSFVNAAEVFLRDGQWRGRYWAEADGRWDWVDIASDLPGITACMLAVEDAARVAGVVLPGAEPVAVTEGASEVVP